MTDERGVVFGECSGHDHDARLVCGGDAGCGEGFTNNCAFGWVGDAEPWGSCLCEDGSAECSGVAIGVGFDYSEDCGIVAGCVC